MAKSFLHVGCGQSYKDKTNDVFNTDDWDEVRLDIDPNRNPDIVSSMVNMENVSDNTFDAVYSSHNIEHVYAHEVLKTFCEFWRVLKDDGFLILTCPDIKSVCKAIGNGDIAKKLYSSAAGDIFPLDILYGHRKSIASGHVYMAHKNGFTSQSLIDHLAYAQFKSYCVGEDANSYSLWMIAYKNIKKDIKELENELKKHVVQSWQLNA